MIGYPEVSPEMGYRLAGYADGEGSFAITKQRSGNGARKVSYGCAFIVQVRDDDLAALELYQQATGVGVVYMFQRSASKWTLPGSKPYAKWQVQNKRDCLRLAEIFEQYPLVTKKANDCAIWIQAARYWNGPKPEGQAPLERWFHEIREVRRYDAPDVSETTSDWTPLELFEPDASAPASEPHEHEWSLPKNSGVYRCMTCGVETSDLGAPLPAGRQDSA